MSIVDNKKTADYISNWIRDYANKAGIKTLVLGLSGGIDSALVALLCKRTGMPLVCVNMPCHSSNSAFERASQFAKEYDIPLFKVDLSTAHESIVNQFKVQSQELFNHTHDMNGNGSMGGLRSCL